MTGNINVLRGVKTVIFDMDGVLVNTMPFHYRAWRNTFSKFGIRVSKKEIYLREGERWNKTFEEILKKHRIKVDKAAQATAFEHREKVFKNLFKVKMFKGAETLLKSLKKRDILLGLATGTPRRELVRILPKKIYNMFDVIVPSDETRFGKPHPEPYLIVLKRLGIKPNNALVVENAPNGIKAAKRAGIRCIAISTSLPAPYLKGADLIVHSIRELFKKMFVDKRAKRR